MGVPAPHTGQSPYPGSLCPGQLWLSSLWDSQICPHPQATEGVWVLVVGFVALGSQGS